MSQPQFRVKLVVAAGVAGASLLGATFVGCQSSPSNQAPSGPYGQYGGNQYGGNQFASGANGQQASPYGATPQMASAAGPAGLSPQSQQAFLNETQRLGTQQNLSAQDVVAMARSGVPEQQIAVAVQQRGASLRTTPGVSQYLAQNGVNPAVLGGGQAGSSYPGAYAQVAMNNPQPAYGPNGNPGSPSFNTPGGSGVTSAVYPATQPETGQLQSATYESTLTTPALDTASGASNGAMNGSSWRAMPH